MIVLVMKNYLQMSTNIWNMIIVFSKKKTTTYCFGSVLQKKDCLKNNNIGNVATIRCFGFRKNKIRIQFKIEIVKKNKDTENI